MYSQLTYSGGYAAFQAIMHILSELRNPLFDAPDRQRALRALRMSRLLKENNHTKAWSAVKSMIDKLLGEEAVVNRSQSRSESSGSWASPSMAVSQPPPTTTSVNFPGFVDTIPQYALQQQQPQLQPQPQPDPIVQHVQQTIQPPPQASQMQQMQTEQPWNWDDINFNNIVGDFQQNTEPLPEFDFGFWGDPVNFGNEGVTFPMDGNTFAPFSG